MRKPQYRTICSGKYTTVIIDRSGHEYACKWNGEPTEDEIIVAIREGYTKSTTYNKYKPFAPYYGIIS